MLDFARGCSGMRWRASSRERWLWGKSSCATTSMPQWGSQAGQGYPVAREEPAPDVCTEGKSYRQQLIRNRGLPATARRGSLASPHQSGSSVRHEGHRFPSLSQRRRKGRARGILHTKQNPHPSKGSVGGVPVRSSRRFAPTWAAREASPLRQSARG